MEADDIFGKLNFRLNYLEKWRELAIRPGDDETQDDNDDVHDENGGDRGDVCTRIRNTRARNRIHPDDEWMLSRDVDDLKELSAKCLEVRKAMNEHLPLHDLALDDLLVVKDSAIQGAGSGLYFMPPNPLKSPPDEDHNDDNEQQSRSHSQEGTNDGSTNSSRQIIKSGTTICYYTGHRHNFFSEKFLSDKSYLLCVHGDQLVDPGPVTRIKARYINDPLNEELENCKFVPQPEYHRCAVVATRDIAAGEELFIGYGEFYWSRQSTPGTIHYVFD